MPEYNEWMKKYSSARCFIHSIDHAIDKAGDEARKQMKCIGWKEDMKQTLYEALEALKEKKHSMIEFSFRKAKP